MKTLYQLLFYLALTSILRAEESGDAGTEAPRAHISLREVTKVVLANNPAIKQAENRWRAAVQRVQQANAWDDPRIAGDSRVRRFVDVPPNAFMDQSLTVEQLIPITGKNLLRGRGAAAEALSIFEEVRRAELDVIAKARTSFFRLANAYEQLGIDSKKSKLQLARRAWIPDPALMVKGQRYNDTSQAVSELDAGVSFTVPWVNPSKYSAGVREARENVGAAEQGLDREQKEALRLLRDQLEKIETAHHHVELFRDKLVPQARPAFQATRLSYESGKASFLDWISAQRNLRDIEATARQHLADYQIAVAELEAVTGTELYAWPAQQLKAERKSQ